MRLISDGDRQLPIRTVITARQQVEKDTQTVPLCVLQVSVRNHIRTACPIYFTETICAGAERFRRKTPAAELHEVRAFQNTGSVPIAHAG